MTFLKFFKSPTFLYAALGAFLFWAALPPLDFWPLAWIAPVPWIMLIRRKELAGPKPYFALWVVGFGFWMAALHWLRLPHPMTGIGWAALAFYFAFYVPAFVGLSRVAVHQLGWHWHLASTNSKHEKHWQDASGTPSGEDASGTHGFPVILAAPVVWTGLELARAHVFTGMSMADLAHTQYRWIELIQISDLAGQLGVCFVIVFVAACIARLLPCESSPLVFWPLAPAAAMLAIVLAYGYWRTANEVTRPGPRIALIQGSIDTTFGGDEREMRDEFYTHYFALSEEAVKEAAAKNIKIDLIVWPEIFFKERLISYDTDAGDNDPAAKQAKLSGEAAREQIRSWSAKTELAFVETTSRLGTPMLIGLDTWHFAASGVKNFNSAAYISKSGKLLNRYDKIHLVPFGEYIPFADLLPWLYNGLTPLSGGMTPGKEPLAMDLEYTASSGEKASIRFAPNICYETVFSRDIRRQINVLQAQGREPDVLINLSNDGWYWGSSELDQLLACSVFRAVECRKPYLVAANTGFSASIDASGRLLAKGPRHDTDTILAEVRLDSRRSFYVEYGDWPAGICLTCCIFFAIVGIWRRYRQRRFVRQELKSMPTR